MLVSATVWVALVPVVKLPKLSEVGDAESCRVGVTPVPESATTNGELGELFTSVRLPEKLPAEAGAKLTAKEDVPPGGTESGRASPEILKPVPDKSAWVRLRLAVPGLLMVRVCEPVEPTDTLPKLVLAGITEICGCTPVPLRVMVAGELVALLVTEMVPEKLPVVVGAKATLMEVDCPAERVRGRARPVTLNPLPVKVSCERVSAELPALVRITLWVALVPVVKFPKPSEVGDAEICRVEETPVPTRATADEELGELFVSVRLPENVPAEAGANLTEKDVEPPGGTLRGRVNPERLKPVPDKSA